MNEHKICDDKFGGCKKINKKIDAYGHDAVDSGTNLCPWPRDDILNIMYNKVSH